MGNANKKGAISFFFIFEIFPIMKEKPDWNSLERVGKMDGDEKCLVEADKEEKAGRDEREWIDGLSSKEETRCIIYSHARMSH